MSRTVAADELHPLDLEQQKKRAKELCRGLARGDAAALQRFRAQHPKSEGLTDAQLVRHLAKVTEAQLVIARELGLASWPRLRQHIARHVSARAEVASGATSIDDEIPTTHVRCGSDIKDDLRRAGLRGRFVEFYDPYCQGPVPQEGDLTEIRAQFIADAYDISLEMARADLRRQQDDLAASIRRERVVLWFEHDSFDQLILARILAYYAEYGTPCRLELVQVDSFPAVLRFHGLGELSAAALRMLWDDRVAVTPEQLALGSRVWRALREPSPIALHDTARSSAALPQMGAALMRHLQELPWVEDGLSLTQRLTLQLVAEQPASAGNIFGRLSMEREPLVHLGDSMFWALLKEMLRARLKPIEADATGDETVWLKRVLSLTPSGRKLLAGRMDWLDCAPPQRWVGGVRIEAGRPCWRWDPVAAAPRWQ